MAPAAICVPTGPGSCGAGACQPAPTHSCLAMCWVPRTPEFAAPNWGLHRPLPQGPLPWVYLQACAPPDGHANGWLQCMQAAPHLAGCGESREEGGMVFTCAPVTGSAEVTAAQLSIQCGLHCPRCRAVNSSWGIPTTDEGHASGTDWRGRESGAGGRQCCMEGWPGSLG